MSVSRLDIYYLHIYLLCNTKGIGMGIYDITESGRVASAHTDYDGYVHVLSLLEYEFVSLLEAILSHC